MDMTGEDVSVSYLQEIEQGKCNSREWCHYLAKVLMYVRNISQVW